MPSEIIDGREFEVEDPYVDVDGNRFGTGLWIPHQPEAYLHPMASAVASAGVRDQKDIEAILANPNRTPAEKLFPPDKWTRSQGQVGSCAGYAGAWALARARVRSGMEPVFLSGESLYSQSNRGRDMGSALEANIKAMVSTGVAPEGLNQAGKFYTESTLPEAAKRERHRFRAFEFHHVRSDFELAAASALGFITGVAIHVGGAWRRLNGDVLIGNSGPGNHAVLVDDVRIRNGRYEHRMVNSHGLNWGQKGVAWTTWQAHYASTVRNHMFYAIRACRPDPQGKNPPKLAA